MSPNPKLLMPPAEAHIPAAPSGFVPTLGNEFRGVTPKTTHLAALPAVLEELERFDDFAEVFGKTTPNYDAMLGILQAAQAWSLQRAQMRAWDDYCRTQEGLAWRDLRRAMKQLAVAYALATVNDSTVGSRYPGFARLLGASSEIAKRAADTRREKKRQRARAELAAATPIPNEPEDRTES